MEIPVHTGIWRRPPGWIRDWCAMRWGQRGSLPVALMSGLIGPECAVADDARDLTRLLAIFGRRNPLAYAGKPQPVKLGADLAP
jgi:hypothetical protein